MTLELSKIRAYLVKTSLQKHRNLSFAIFILGFACLGTVRNCDESEEFRE